MARGTGSEDHLLTTTSRAKNGPVARSTPARNAAEQLETRPPRPSKAEKPHRGVHEPQSKGANEASVGWGTRFFSADIRRLERQVKQLKVENKKLNDDLDDWEEYDISRNEEIADLRRDILAKGPASYHLDDEDVKSHFKSLRATICNIAYFRYRCGATGGAVPTVTRRQFEFIARDPELYMETRRKEQVIRAFIWTYLISHVFSLSGLLWAGDGHENVESLSSTNSFRSHSLHIQGRASNLHPRSCRRSELSGRLLSVESPNGLSSLPQLRSK